MGIQKARIISYLVNNDQLGFLKVLHPESGSPIHTTVIQEFNQVHHLFEANGVSAINSLLNP